MPKFLGLYIGSTSEAEKAAAPPDPARDAEGMAAWGRWMSEHAANILDAGGPLGATLKASPAGVSTTRNMIAGYVIVEAETHEAAARMFEGHPHFAIFPGDSVEVLACLDIPRA